ncbi:MAG: family 5 extracellular solute-binding protein [Geminicoccaceae bacterium]|nr:family 5 extracellular solute-binding protein [Geminicoccaceae bacterium]
MDWPGLTRRRLLQGAGALGVARPRVGWAEPRVLRVRASADLQVLDPAHRKAQAEGDILRCVFPRLIEWRTGDLWGWRLGAASAIEQDGPTRVRFTLRPGILFTGGFGEMTADDVKFSYERIVDPAQRSEYRDDFAALDRVDVLDRYAGVIVLKEPFAPLWTSTLPSASGCILSRKAVEQAGGRFTTAPPATAGPYVIREWRPKQRLTLVRSPDWSGPPGGFDEIRILPIEDEKAAEIAFEAGELDYSAISVSSIPGYRTGKAPGVRLVEKPSLDYVWLGINLEAPPFDDPRVRRAVQRAIEAAYFGVARRATGIIAPGLIGHREKLLGDPRPDLDEARALLAEAGHAGGFACTLAIEAKAERLLAAQVIQAQLGKVKIAVQIDQHDSGSFWSLGSEADGERWRALQLVLQKYGMQPDPSFATAWFTPEQVGIWNWERFSRAEFGALHRAAMVETDPARRARMYRRMQDLMEESGAYVFLTHEVNAELCRDAVAPALLPDATPVLPEFRPA